MSTITKEAHLVCTDIGLNNNKFWNAWLYDDNHIEVQYGRIGETSARETVSATGPVAFDRLVAKKKKGKKDKDKNPCSVYTEARTIASGSVSVTNVAKGDLLSIARKQIKTNSPTLDELIKRLVEANIHQITSHTDVNYDASSGLFTTPLGIVTIEGISEARTILSEAVTLVQKNDYGTELTRSINQYLRIVPQRLGRRAPDPKTFFPDIAAIQKQNDILDSLESSYKAMQDTPKTDDDKEKVLEQVFQVKLETLDDATERARIKQKYLDTRKDVHVCKHLKVKEIFVVEIGQNVKAFETGSKVGEIHELWHGTKKANLLSILKSGLRVAPPSTARIAGKMFGNGVYFANDSTKSLNYSFGYWDGQRETNCFMFLADVAMGKYYVPQGSYESLPKAGYDSTWAKSGRSGVMNDELVVYKDDRFKLKYLVEFE